MGRKIARRKPGDLPNFKTKAFGGKVTVYEDIHISLFLTDSILIIKINTIEKQTIVYSIFCGNFYG